MRGDDSEQPPAGAEHRVDLAGAGLFGHGFHVGKGRNGFDRHGQRKGCRESCQDGCRRGGSLIPLSLGGSNSTKNLWPESYLTEPWNAHTKDQLEYKLLQLVRSGQVDLHTAQQEIAVDWITAYKKYVSPTPQASGQRGKYHPSGTGNEYGDVAAYGDEQPDTDAPTAAPASTQTAPTAAAGQVWVNTRSGVIWKPGSRYYGKTKEGKYMAADAALQAGYHYAGGTGN